MNVQEYWQQKIAAGLDPFVFISLITLRGIERLCPFLDQIKPVERDQTGQSTKWETLATALGIDPETISTNDRGTIDLGIQLQTKGTFDGALLADFLTRPQILWHARWVCTVDSSGMAKDTRLEIRQGPSAEGSGALSGAQFAAILRRLAGPEGSPTGVRLNFPNVWRNPPDLSSGQSADSANILLYVPSEGHSLYVKETDVAFVCRGGQAFVNVVGIPHK
ncbi:MAG: hypothetical protein WC227_00710 [Patescibacteria group bacterium]|jgi:hypothetical protein